MKEFYIFKYKIFSDSLKTIDLNKTQIISTISPQCYGFAKKDKIYENALKNSDIIVMDSFYFGVIAKWVKGVSIKRYYGYELFEYLMGAINNVNGRVFFLGSTNHVIDTIIGKVKIIYPNIKSAGYSPSFTEKFTEKENNEIIDSINKFQAKILFVGMSAPKQEKWVESQKDKINVPIICSIGAVFEWFAGTQKKIHPIWFKLGLGWLMRIIQRPELIKRMPFVLLFFKDSFLAALKLKEI